MKKKIAIAWFRRDLRLEDNAAFYYALKSGIPVLPAFIFDTNILDDLSDKKDARVTFLNDTINSLSKALQDLNSSILVGYGDPKKVWKKWLKEYTIEKVFVNRDYETYAINRDEEVKGLLDENNISFHDYKDHVIFEKNEVTKDDGLPYTVFTPYSKKWKAKLMTRLKKGNDVTSSYFFKSYPNKKYFKNLVKVKPFPIPTLKKMGFEKSDIKIPSKTVQQKIIKQYGDNRDFPAKNGTSRLGIHFRFGTISIREKARKSVKMSSVYLSELIWRDFYSQILYHFPHVITGPFRAKYDAIPWRNNKKEFDLWCAGQTGYPIVDAGMRELNTTGHMHNRVRMVVASFLTKHLLIDWKWGEAYFAEKLLDFDLASNNGGWQWAAGCGTDAAPYFRIFNPESQMKKFDKELKYIKQWVPEYGTDAYVEPMVDHKEARERCLVTYKAALAQG